MALMAFRYGHVFMALPMILGCMNKNVAKEKSNATKNLKFLI